MIKLILSRIATGIGTLFAASLLIFFCTEILPGDVAGALLGKEATPQTIAALRQALRLDDPAPLRYLHWLGAFLSGDFGHSLANGRPVWEGLAPRFANTLFLALYTALLAVPVSVALGIFSAIKPQGFWDRLGSFFSVILISLPEFFVAYLLVLFFAVHLHWFPSLSNVGQTTGFSERLILTFLPMLTLSCVIFSHILRMTRAALLDIMAKPYIEMAQLKGLSPFYIMTCHVLPNAIGPIAYAIALNLAHLMLGVVVVEAVFVYPGMGQWMVDAVGKRDLPIVQACGIVFAAIFILLNLLADLFVLISNPRLRYPR